MKKIKNKLIYCLFLIIILLFYGAFYSYNLIKKSGNYIISYIALDDSNIEVYYKEDTYLNGKANSTSYIKKYLDKILINFDYKINLSKNMKASSSYLVKSKIIIKAPNSDDILWQSSPEYLIKETKEQYDNNNYLSHKNTAIINYQKYLDIYETFKNETSVISNAKILVEFISSSNLIDYNKNINETISYDIPLSDNVLKISKNTSSKINKAQIIENNNNLQHKYLIFFITDLSLLLLTILVLLIYYYRTKRKNWYQNTLKKILKTYDSIIVNIKSPPTLKKLNAVEVTSFEELVDAQLELRVPINFYEKEKNKTGIFFIINNGIMWLYKLKETRKEDKNEK